MEAPASTNSRPKLRRGLSRRASMSALPSYSMSDGKRGSNKKELKSAYKEEKKTLKKGHRQVEKEFQKAMKSVELEHVSSLADEEETMVTKVNLETFDMPKASRRQRRASLNMTLRILTPPKTPKVKLEDIDSIPNAAPLPVAPLLVDRRSGLTKSLSCTFEAEALAGWKTVVFREGPIGIKLEATNNNKGARVIGFQDTDGVPSQARASGQIATDDVIVKVGNQVPKSFEHALELLQVPGERVVTFRPSFSYELQARTERRGGRKKKSRSKRSLLAEDDEEEEGEPEVAIKPRRIKKNSLIVHNDDFDDDGEETDILKSKLSSHKKLAERNNRDEKTDENGGDELSDSKSFHRSPDKETDENGGDDVPGSKCSRRKSPSRIEIKAFKPNRTADSNKTGGKSQVMVLEADAAKKKLDKS